MLITGTRTVNSAEDPDHNEHKYNQEQKSEDWNQDRQHRDN